MRQATLQTEQQRNSNNKVSFFLTRTTVYLVLFLANCKNGEMHGYKTTNYMYIWLGKSNISRCRQLGATAVFLSFSYATHSVLTENKKNTFFLLLFFFRSFVFISFFRWFRISESESDQHVAHIISFSNGTGIQCYRINSTAFVFLSLLFSVTNQRKINLAFIKLPRGGEMLQSISH